MHAAALQGKHHRCLESPHVLRRHRAHDRIAWAKGDSIAQSRCAPRERRPGLGMRLRITRSAGRVNDRSHIVVRNRWNLAGRRDPRPGIDVNFRHGGCGNGTIDERKRPERAPARCDRSHAPRDSAAAARSTGATASRRTRARTRADRRTTATRIRPRGDDGPAPAPPR